MINPTRPDTCSQRLLARGKSHHISICSCGTIHLSFANTTLRLSRRDFDQLAGSVLAAQQGLVVEEAATPQGALQH